MADAKTPSLTETELAALREQRARDGRCVGCGVESSAPHAPDCQRNTWLSRKQVIERFNVDPRGHDEPGHAQPIRSKLTRRLVRVYFLEDVEAVAPSLPTVASAGELQEERIATEIGQHLDEDHAKRNRAHARYRRTHGF